MTRRAIYQFVLLVISVSFEAVRHKDYVDCFSVLCMEEIHITSFIYYVGEHFIIIALAVMVWKNDAADVDLKTDRFFVILCVLDFVDYLLTGNNVWWKSPKLQLSSDWFLVLPISMNLCSVVFFIIYANWQWRITTNGKQ